MATLYKVKLKTKLDGQEMLNTFNYIGTGVDVNSEFLELFIRTVVIEFMRLIQSTLLEYVEMAIEDVYFPSNSIITQFPNLNGLVTGDVYPAFATWSYQLVPALAGYRSGRKAFSGVGELDCDSFDPTAAARLKLDDLADAIQTQFSVDLFDAKYFPVIVNTNAGGGQWANPIAIAPFKRISTQNTRKRYTSGYASISLGGANIPYTPPVIPLATFTHNIAGKAIEEWVTQFGALTLLELPATPAVPSIPLP